MLLSFLKPGTHQPASGTPDFLKLFLCRCLYVYVCVYVCVFAHMCVFVCMYFCPKAINNQWRDVVWYGPHMTG